MRVLGAVPVLVLILSSPPARAQYRPPPPTEAAERLREGDDLRQEAARLDSKGDRSGADDRYRRAADRYERALAADLDGKQAVPAAAGLGAACTALHDYARAARALAPVAASHPEATDVKFHLAVALYKLKRYAEALPLLDEVCKKGAPEHFIAHYYRGVYAIVEKDGTGALEALQRYLTLRPAEIAGDDYQIHELVGRAYLLLRKAPEARAAFTRAQAGRPESVSAQMGVEAALELEGKRAEAVALLGGLAQRHPAAVDVKQRLGALLLAGGDYARAADIAQQLVKQQPSPTAHVLLGDVRLAQKQARPAEQQYREALKLQADFVPAQLGLSRTLEQLGKSAEAIELLTAAARAHPEDLALQGALGSACRRAGRFQQAIEVHQVVVDRAPRNPLGQLLLGADHFATGQWDEAIADYSAALKLDPAEPRARHWLALALARRAQVRARSNLIDDAVLDLRRAFDLDRTTPIGEALAALLLTRKQFLEAEAALKSIANPGWREPLLLGYALLGNGDAKAALTSFEQAGLHAPDGATRSDAYVGWALAKLELGDFETAVGKLSGPSESPAALKVMRANLPIALVRLGLRRLDENDVAGAQKVLDAATALPESRRAPVSAIAELLRGLIAMDRAQWAQAESSIGAALSKKEPWFEPYARPLLTAYLEYRRGRLKVARAALATARKLPGADKVAWAQELTRAIGRREAEQLYAEGALPKAEQLLKSLAAADPLNAVVTHNLAALRYRRGAVDAAVTTFRQVADTIPEAELNLGLHAQYRQRDARAAMAHYQKYIAAGGARAPTVREWVDRIERLQGLDAAPAAAPAADRSGR